MKKNIFLVDDGTDIDTLRNAIQNVTTPTIFALDYNSHKKLERKNIDHLLGDDVLSKEDFEKIDDLVISLTKNCFSKYENSLTFNDISLPELIQHEFFQYLLQQFLKPQIIFNILKKFDIYSLYDFTIYASFIKKIINDDVKYNQFKSSEKISLYHDKVIFNIPIGQTPIHLEMSRKNFIKLKKPLQKATDILYNLKPDTNTKKNLLLVNFDVVEFEDLLKSLNKLNVNFLLLNTRKPAITGKKSLQIIKNTNSKVINLSDFQKKVSNEISFSKNLLNETKKIMENDDSFFKKSFCINSISFWPCIKQLFFNICYTRFNESIERISLLKQIYNEYDIALNFLWIDVGQEEKECIIMGKKFDIESVMIQHGRFQTSTIWDKFASYLGQFPAPMLSDKQIVWGEITKKYALSLNHLEKNIIVGGSPRHDKFFNNKKTKSSNGKIVLATTGTMFLSANTCTATSQIHYDEFFKEIYHIVKKLPGKQLIVKSHPSQILRKMVQDLIDELDSSIIMIENTNNFELFDDCDMVITFNNSTTSLEALSQGTPVISLQTEQWALEDDIAQSNAIISISKLPDCEKYIRKILVDTEFRETLIKNGHQFLSEYMSNQSNASMSVATILKNLINKTKNSI